MIATLAMMGALLDQGGAPFSLRSLRGHPTVVTFVAARCVDACPLIDAQIAQAADDARRRGSRLRFVTLTLDPRHDRVAAMAKLARIFHADPRYWRLATGSPSTLQTLMRAFGVQTQDDERGYPAAHTTFVYLLDASGNLAHTILPSARLSATLAQVAER